MQGRSDIKTASDLNSHQSAETDLQSHDGERSRKRAQSMDVVRDLRKARLTYSDVHKHTVNYSC